MITIGLFILLGGLVFFGLTMFIASSCMPDALNLISFIISLVLLIVGGVLTGYDILILTGIL